MTSETYSEVYELGKRLILLYEQDHRLFEHDYEAFIQSLFYIAYQVDDQQQVARMIEVESLLEDESCIAYLANYYLPNYDQFLIAYVDYHLKQEHESLLLRISDDLTIKQLTLLLNAFDHDMIKVMMVKKQLQVCDLKAIKTDFDVINNLKTTKIKQYLYEQILDVAYCCQDELLIEACIKQLFMLTGKVKWYLALRNELHYQIEQIEPLFINQTVNQDYYINCMFQGLMQESLEELFISKNMDWIDDALIAVCLLGLMIIKNEKGLDIQALNIKLCDLLQLNCKQAYYVYENIQALQIKQVDLLIESIEAICSCINKQRRIDLYELSQLFKQEVLECELIRQ